MFNGRISFISFKNKNFTDKNKSDTENNNAAPTQKIKKERADYLFMAMVSITVFAVIMLIISLSSSTVLSPAGAALVNEALANTGQNGSFSINISEKAGIHNIHFSGRVEKNQVYGKIHEYGIFVWLQDDKLMVRPDRESPWEEATALKLQDLKSFIAPPETIFTSMGEEFKSGSILPNDPVAGRLTRIVYWNPKETRFWSDIFPPVEGDTIKGGIVAATITGEEPVLEKVEIIFIMTGPCGKELHRISRTLTITAL